MVPELCFAGMCACLGVATADGPWCALPFSVAALAIGRLIGEWSAGRRGGRA